jgi:hypothetical protein
VIRNAGTTDGLRAICVACALAGPAACSTAAPPDAGARTEVLAPIESAEIVIRESFPPQYAARIVSGLPSGCAAFERIDVDREDSVIEISVWNTIPTDPNLACTMIYGTMENTAELGSDYEPGRSYEAIINGETRISFGAQ